MESARSKQPDAAGPRATVQNHRDLGEPDTARLRSRLGLTWFTSRARVQNEGASLFSDEDRARAIAGYRIMASYVKRLYDAGVELNVGTDAPDPGKAGLSEMLLLHDAGIPMAGVFRIATLETAVGIGHGSEYGLIEPGRRADLILFDGEFTEAHSRAAATPAPVPKPASMRVSVVQVAAGFEWTANAAP